MDMPAGQTFLRMFWPPQIGWYHAYGVYEERILMSPSYKLMYFGNTTDYSQVTDNFHTCHCCCVVCRVLARILNLIAQSWKLQKFIHMLEIDILRNSLQNVLGALPWRVIFEGLGVQKVLRRPAVLEAYGCMYAVILRGILSTWQSIPIFL